jgi:hypothetical protein
VPGVFEARSTIVEASAFHAAVEELATAALDHNDDAVREIVMAMVEGGNVVEAVSDVVGDNVKHLNNGFNVARTAEEKQRVPANGVDADEANVVTFGGVK